jgi:hypothetical protein
MIEKYNENTFLIGNSEEIDSLDGKLMLKTALNANNMYDREI